VKEYTPETIRNIGLFGHASAGKTTFNELALFIGGETTRIGKIEEGNTVSDYTANEIERKSPSHSLLVTLIGRTQNSI